MQVSNQFYDIAKWFVLIFLPALAVLLGGLGDLYSWEDTQLLVANINLFTVFLGSVLQISSQSYHKDQH